jgi:hypothetical protein
MALLLVGVLIQFIRYEGGSRFYAPMFYIGGLGFALCGLQCRAVRLSDRLDDEHGRAAARPAGFLSLYALLIFMLGLLFRGVNDGYVLFMGWSAFLPVLVSLLARRSLAIFTKRMK